MLRDQQLIAIGSGKADLWAVTKAWGRQRFQQMQMQVVFQIFGLWQIHGRCMGLADGQIYGIEGCIGRCMATGDIACRCARIGAGGGGGGGREGQGAGSIASRLAAEGDEGRSPEWRGERGGRVSGAYMADDSCLSNAVLMSPLMKAGFSRGLTSTPSPSNMRCIVTMKPITHVLNYIRCSNS